MGKAFFVGLFTLLLAGLSATAQKKTEELVWQTDILKAQELSLKSKKPIFAFFTGSDWCGWCHRLQANVFAKPEFKKWANKNVILLELDFPRRKEQSDELRKQNADLQQAFQVRGYPTIWIFNLAKDEKENKFNIAALGSLGYPSGSEPGKEEVAFINTANGILNNK